MAPFEIIADIVQVGCVIVALCVVPHKDPNGEVIDIALDENKPGVWDFRRGTQRVFRALWQRVRQNFCRVSPLYEFLQVKLLEHFAESRR